MNPLKVCPQCGTEYPANARFCELDGTALRSAGGQQDLVGSIVADRYHVLRKLGEGGMGQVYLAEHVKMGRKSALKVMHPGMVKDVDAISRFNREAANASRISHPNVAAVYDFGETPDGIIYLAMEFVDGPPLTQLIEQTGALPPKRAAEIVRQTGDALAVAHDMGIVHRDLKPDNIMIARTRDGGDLVKVVDFGIAKAAGSDAQKVTKTGLVVGTPEYMSPEQLAGDTLDGRSDIYSLGLVAFNMLTGKLPFPATSAQESMIMRLTDRPKSLAEMRPEVAWPADVQAVIDRALEREVHARYQTAAEFGRDLQQAIARMPDTLASEVGTQLVSAIPPTRVAGESPVAAPPRTSIGAGSLAARPSASPATSVTQAAASGGQRSKVALVGGGVALVAVVAAAVMVPPMLSAGDGAPPDTAANASVLTANGNDTGARTVVPTGQPSANSQGTTSANPPSSGASGAVNPGAAKSVAEQLSALIDASKDPARAASVQAAVDRLEPLATTSEELSLVAAVRSNAFVSQKDTASACRALKAVLKDPRLIGDQRERTEDRVSNVYNCQ